jgi:S-adenosylmethionine decarboxylase
MSGCEWIIDARGCDPASLADLNRLKRLFARLIDGMNLHPVGDPLWHQFPITGGVTGLCLLSESHVACHTFPEHGTLCLNIFCCRERPDWDFEAEIEREFGASDVDIRRLGRSYAEIPA